MALVGTPKLNGQEKDLKPVLPQDSTAKQILKDEFARQLTQATPYSKSHAACLQRLVGDSLFLDSLGSMVLLQLQLVKKSVVNTGSTIINDGVQISKDALQQRLSALIQTQAVKNIIPELTGIVKQPLLRWKGGMLQTNGQTGTWFSNGASIIMNSSSLTGNWMVMGIPLGMQMLRQNVGGPETYSRNVFSFQFDKEVYLNSLRDKIRLKIKQQDLFAYDQLLQEIKKKALARLKSSIDSISAPYSGELREFIARVSNTNDFLNVNTAAIKNRLEELLPTQKVKQDKILFELRASDSLYSPLTDSLLKVLQIKQDLSMVVDLISSIKTELQPDNVPKKLLESSAPPEREIKQLINEPDKLKAMAREQLGLNGMQKLFLNISQLKMGVHTVCLSPLSVNQFINNGVSASFYNNKEFLFLMAGKQNGSISAFCSQQGYAVFPVSSSAMGISIGSGDITMDHTHLGMFRYQYGKGSEHNDFISTMPGHTVVSTLSNQFTIGETGRLLFEVSASAHSYNNHELINDTLQQGNPATKQFTNARNIFEQMAFIVQWNGASEEKQLAYDLYIGRTGEAYNNPGNLFIASGVTELGGSLRKELLGNRLQLSSKTNYRAYQFSSIGTRWVNYNFSLQAKWKFKKGQYIAMRYQPYYSIRTQYATKYIAATNNRLSVESNFRRRFGKINYQHSIGLSVLRSGYTPDSIPSANNAIDFSSMQTASINKRSYYLSMQYSKSGNRQGSMLLSTQFNTEAGCMYSIHNGLFGSSAIHYSNMQHRYRQTGIKQSISGQIGERFTVTLFADLQKKIRTYMPFYMGGTSFNWSLQYMLK